jgi:Rne/Rng family ribonuclease
MPPAGRELPWNATGVSSMNKEMIVSSNDHETMVAILEDDQVVELFIERERNRGVVGNVYKGRVSKVLPGMQSAFVDLGLERDGFLYVSDVVPTTDQFERLEAAEADNPAATAETLLETVADAAPEAQAGVMPAAEPDVLLTPADPYSPESVDGGDASTLSPPAWSQRSAARPDSLAREDEGLATDSLPNVNEGLAAAGSPPAGSQRSAARPDSLANLGQANTALTIDQLLHEGQEVLVQVVKEPLGSKGARITSHVSIAGRFLVFMPTVDHVGVSRKIDSREERARLRGIVRQFRERHGFTGGVIIRTAAAGRPESDIVGDLTEFHQIWQEIRQRMDSSRPPAAIYREQSLVAKLLRDLLSDEFQAIRIDSLPEYRKTQQLVQRIMPALLPRLKLYTKDYPIFEEYGVRNEIDKALRSKVWLKSGGYIVINQTEALVAIDVNTGRYVGKKTGRLEDTIVKTNLEAVKEIVRQLRLRDLGGIIVLDFIDMEERKNRQKVFQALEQELRKDRSPSKAVQVSEFGLVIVTRKRVKQSLERMLTDPCPYCSGTGIVKSTATICFDILTEMRKVGPELNGQGVLLRVNPEIAKALREEEQSVLRDLERAVGRRIQIKPDASLHHEQFDVMAI